MSSKIPPDAFALYVSMGLDRSYQRVADAFKVSKRAIVNAASRENWTGRLKSIEERSREKLDEKLGEEITEMRERHLKLLRAMAGRAAKAIQDYPLTTGMEGMKVAEMVMRMERVLASETSQRDGAVIEKTTRQEIDRLLAFGESDSSGERGGDGVEEDW